jgi:hypothetical protein
MEYDKGKIEGHKLEIQEILTALNAPGESQNRSDDEPHSLSADPRDDTSTSRSGRIRPYLRRLCIER